MGVKCSSRRGWKVVKSLSLGLDIARWFSRALEGSLKIDVRSFTLLTVKEVEALSHNGVQTPVAFTWLWWSMVGEVVAVLFLFLGIGMEWGGESLWRRYRMLVEKAVKTFFHRCLSRTGRPWRHLKTCEDKRRQIC